MIGLQSIPEFVMEIPRRAAELRRSSYRRLEVANGVACLVGARMVGRYPEMHGMVIDDSGIAVETHYGGELPDSPSQLDPEPEPSTVEWQGPEPEGLACEGLWFGAEGAVGYYHLGSDRELPYLGEAHWPHKLLLIKFSLFGAGDGHDGRPLVSAGGPTADIIRRLWKEGHRFHNPMLHQAVTRKWDMPK